MTGGPEMGAWTIPQQAPLLAPAQKSLFLPSDFSKKATQWESALQTDFFLRSQQEGESLDVSKASPF